MRYEYFVSFARIANHGAGLGFSYATFTLDQPMSADAIKQVNDRLAEQNPGWSVVILSFQRLESSKPSTASV